MSSPEEYLDNLKGRKVRVYTSEGYEFTGVLMGMDANRNTVLENVVETNPITASGQEKRYKSVMINGSIVSIVSDRVK